MKKQIEQKWAFWKECLSGEDVNSIFGQIYILYWDHAVYKVLLRARNNRIAENPDKPQINKAFHSFIDRNYFSNNLMRIRRLVDSTTSTLEGRRGVFSLRSFIRDIDQNKQYLSRETYFRLRNLSYDFESVKAKGLEYMLNLPPGEAIIPAEYDWHEILEAHASFDFLSCTKPSDRQKSDIIHKSILERLNKKLDQINPLLIHADKFIAHSATPESRSFNDLSETKILISDIWKAYKIIFAVARFLSYYFFGIERIPFVLEGINFYEYWDVPLYRENEIEDVHLVLDEYRKELENTLMNDHRIFIKELKE